MIDTSKIRQTEAAQGMYAPLPDRKTEYKALPFYQHGLVEMYSAILKTDFGDGVTSESVAFVYGLIMYLDDLMHAPYHRLQISLRDAVDWCQTWALYSEDRLKRIRAGGVRGRVFQAPSRSGQLIAHAPSSVLAELVGGSASIGYVCYELPRYMGFDKRPDQVWRGNILALMVSPADGLPIGRDKIHALTGYDDDMQRRAGLGGSANRVIIPLKRGDYLDLQFLKRQRAFVSGAEIVLIRGNTYKSLARLRGSLSFEGQRFYGQHYYYESERAAQTDEFHSQYYVVKTDETKQAKTGKTTQLAKVWRPGIESRFTTGPFRPYPPAYPPGLLMGDTLNAKAFWPGFLGASL